MKNKTVIYAIINWGLGHATRSTPIIRRLLSDGNRVILVAHGEALSMLKQEFPECEFRSIKDKKVGYPHIGFLFVFKIVSQVPKMLLGWEYERRNMRQLEKEFNPDLIITEMRLGFWSKKVPSVLITHQLRFHLPRRLAWGEIFGEWFNVLVFRKFNYVFVPDAKGTPNLSGDLSHKGNIAKHPKVRYIGCLSSITPAETPPEKDIDILISISGPEPQRSIFEKKVMNQIETVPGKIAVALGLPEAGKITVLDDGRITIYPYLNREAMANMIQRAKHIVCRSGYSTIMELLALKKSALIIPTPGQTEQEYLADYYRQEGLFSVCSQDTLDLSDIRINSFQHSKKHHIPINQLDYINQLLESLCT